MTNFLRIRTRRWGRGASVFAVGIVTIVALVTGCEAGSPRSELAENQRILSSCDQSAPPASLVQFDGTGSSASDAIATERMAVVESVAQRTAVCSGICACWCSRHPARPRQRCSMGHFGWKGRRRMLA